MTVWMLNVSCTCWPQDDDSSVFLSFRPFFQATVFSKLMQNDPFGRVSIMQFFNYVMRKVWLHQTRIGLSLYDVAGQGYLKESVGLCSHIVFLCTCTCEWEGVCVCVLFLQRCMWVCQKSSKLSWVWHPNAGRNLLEWKNKNHITISDSKERCEARRLWLVFPNRVISLIWAVLLFPFSSFSSSSSSSSWFSSFKTLVEKSSGSGLASHIMQGKNYTTTHTQSVTVH